MLCASCASVQSDHQQPCSICHGPVSLAKRYLLMEILEASGVGITYLARDLERDDAPKVIVKELSFGRVDSLKTHQLFEREARLLQQLHHPRIPAYLDDFVWGVGKHQSHYLVESYIPGQTLTQAMQSERYDEADVLAILSQLCDILEYLHTRQPAVIHRDIKPQNIIQHQDTGELYLIDFGAVRDQAMDTLGGTTIVGTFGYMAPEQFAAQASPASDVYALGMLAVELLSRKALITMLDGNHNLRWQPHVQVSDVTRRLLEAMTQSELHTRMSTVAEVREGIARAMNPTSPGVSTALIHPAQTALAPRRNESLFGIICFLVAVPLFAMPCMVAVFGFTNVAIGSSIFLMSVILMTPFLPINNEVDPE